MDLEFDVQVYSSEPLEVKGEPLYFPGKDVTVLHIAVDSGVLALVALSTM
jgi:hypothetical protein